MPSYKVEMPIEQAEAISDKFIEQFNKNKEITNIQVTGSIRRKESKVGDIDIVVEIEYDLSFLAYIPGFDIKESGTDRVTGIYQNQQINVFRAEKEYWGATILYTTGPKGSAIGMRMKAKFKNMTLNQYGLFDTTGKKIAGKTEEGIFEALGHKMKPPELRGK